MRVTISIPNQIHRRLGGATPYFVVIYVLEEKNPMSVRIMTHYLEEIQQEANENLQVEPTLAFEMTRV